MVFAILDTPRTEIGDQTRMSGFNDPDFSTSHSIPSPSKESNDLLKQIRGMRNSTSGGKHPRSRLPLTDRRNLASKGEFTPLLKSATRNSFMRSSGPGKENVNFNANSQLETPVGLKANYGRDNSPALPFNSSVMIEEHTGSSAENDEAQRSIVAPPVGSSSVLSTPLALQHRQADGPLNNGGNLATLREQEARLEQIDKENFSLKLKIHFLEEALRRNGKEFNESAVRENTELKVDKVTLQRDLKHYRKLLAQAEKDLENYRQQLKEYMEKVKRRHVSEDMQEELDQLRANVTDGEAKIEQLQQKLEASQTLQEQVDKLQDDCSDLEAEIRQKDRELDEKDEELQNLRENGSGDDDLKQQLEEKTRLLEEKEDDIEGLQEALRNAESITDEKLQEKQRLLEEKDDELRDLEEQLKDQSLLRSKDQEGQKILDEKDEEIRDLKQRLESSSKDASSVEQLKEQLQELQGKLQTSENEFGAESRKKNHTIEEKDFEIRNLEQKLQSADGRDNETEKLQDQIADLEADLREKERLVEEKVDQIDNLNDAMHQAKQHADDELNECEDRIQELETQHQQHLTQLQELRDTKSAASDGRSQALDDAQIRIRELEDQREVDNQQEKYLQADINKLHDQIKRLEANIRDKEAAHVGENEKWASDRRSLESEKSRAEEQAAGLQRTITQLQESEGTLSSREMQLQRALQSEEERHRGEEESLQKQITVTTDESEERRKNLQETKISLRNVEEELENTKQRLSASTELEASLREKIQGLDDEIEVLQSSLDEDAERAQDELSAAKQEAESLRRQLKGLQQDLAIAQNQGTEGQRLERDLDGTSSPSRKLRQLQDQLSQAKTEKTELQDDLAAANADLDTLQSTMAEMESSRETAQQQSRDLRKQVQDLQREHERKSQSQILSYEQDIQNLEQDLLDANTKHAELEAKNHSAEQQAARLESKIKTLDAQLAASKAQRTSGDTSVAERKDLHEMLKDAKLEAEDLALQIQERDSRITSLSTKETELRAQMQRLRDERSTQTSRADVLGKDLERLQRQHDDLMEEMTSLRALQKQVRFPRSSLSASNASGLPVDDLAAIQKRHAAELRGLVKQIEYLAARCKREGRFRADLSYVKQYFTKQVEMHGRCTQADLRLVRAMGIPVDDVLEKQNVDDEIMRGRVQTLRGTRPSLRCVALMVVAGVRMRNAAERWGVVRKGHDALVRKLKDVQGQRGYNGKAAASGSGSNAGKFVVDVADEARAKGKRTSLRRGEY